MWGPGILVMLADCDAGNVVAAAQSGALWGVGMLPIVLAITPLLYAIQELSVRLGIGTRVGLGTLIRRRLGVGCTWAAITALVVAVLGSLITEFTAVVSIGGAYGVPKVIALPGTVALLASVVLTRSYERMDRAAMLIGAFELCFFVVAWHAHPQLSAMAYQIRTAPYHEPAFVYLAVALVGASFNPWMVFYQQAAVVERKLSGKDRSTARADTAVGAILTQSLTAAVLVAAASAIAPLANHSGLQSIADVANAFSAVIGQEIGRGVFSAGVLGASMVAAIVCSRALATGLHEMTGKVDESGPHSTTESWFLMSYIGALVLSAVAVWGASDLVSLNIAAQVANAALLPIVAAMLIVLSCISLPHSMRPRSAYLVVIGLAVCGVVGAAIFSVLANFAR